MKFFSYSLKKVSVALKLWKWRAGTLCARVQAIEVHNASNTGNYLTLQKPQAKRISRLSPPQSFRYRLNGESIFIRLNLQ